MNKKQAIFTSVAGMALASMMLVGCGSSNTTAPTGKPAATQAQNADKTTATTTPSATASADKTATAKPTSPSAPTQTAGTTPATASATQNGQAPASTQSQKPPGKYGDDMNKVVQSIFTDSRVTQLTAGQKGQLGIVFAGSQNGQSAPVDGKWNVQLTVDQKPIANIVVSESDFKVLSVTSTK